MCFGAATRNLEVPELIPFRLTPHIVSALDPIGVTGFISKSMIHTLRCFKNSKKLLMACMEVFVKEPTLDWLESARNYNTNNIDQGNMDFSYTISFSVYILKTFTSLLSSRNYLETKCLH